MLEIESTATLKDKIESEYTFNGLNYELVNVPVYPAPVISSVSISELPKSKVGKTFNITGGNFSSITDVTSTAGTVTGYTVNSTTSISVTITTNTLTGYASVTVTSATGTTTLSNCIRMYTQVIPGTDVAWNNVTGANTETGAGYIRRNNTTSSAAAGGNFLVTSSTTVDFEVEFYHDVTNYALSLTWSAFTGLSQNATANAANRFVSYNYYWQKANTYQYYQQQMTGSGGSLYYNVFNLRPIVTTRYVHQRIAGKQLIFADNMNNDAGVTISRVPLMTVTYYANTALYMDFTVEQRAGFKNILAKIYD